MSNQTIKSRILIKNGTASNWSTQNPILMKGELGIEIDTRKVKVGDGVTNYNNLKYLNVPYDDLFGPDGKIKSELITFPKVEKPSLYEGTKTTLEGLDKDVISKYFSTDHPGVTPKQGDVFVVTTNVGGTEYSKTTYFYNGSAWVATNGTVDADKVIFTRNTGTVAAKGKSVTDVMTTVQGSVTGLQTDVAELQTNVTGLKDGSVKAKTAELADSATKLATAHNFSITGDGTAEAIPFDGTGDVALNLLLATVGQGGTGCKVTVDTKGRVTQVEALTAGDIPNLTHDKITDLGTAATRNVGTSAGQVVVVAADGKIDSALMPAIAITDIKTVDSQAAMLALKDVQIGDIAIRTDENKSYILTGNTPSDLGSWTWLRTPDCKVLSVNSKTGAVVLTTDDIAEGNTNKYFTATAFTTEFKKHASTELTDTATLLRSTDTLILDGGAVTE